MNTMIFLGGVGSGAVITTILFLLIIHVLIQNKDKIEKVNQETNEASIRELKRRNDIGEDQRLSLRAIAASCEKLTSVLRSDAKIGSIR